MEDLIKKHLTNLLLEMQELAREDARRVSASGLSHMGDGISSVYDRSYDDGDKLDDQKIEEIIRNIDRATSTKEGARRLFNGIEVIAKSIVRIYFPS